MPLTQTRPALLSIIAHARAGALDHAWRLFRDTGLDALTEDPAVVSVRGRLLKDQALGAQGAARQRLYREAAEAYGHAARLGGGTYPLINAATLSLLAGEEVAAAGLARQVLGRIARGEDEAETPYWQGATQAEALLLLGRSQEAQAALAAAIERAPRAWEDHASTLRQFALILAAQGQDAGWLDAHRPPRALHFAGHMALASDAEPLAEQVRDFLEEEGVGFACGALAAGADILIAEALIEHGAELHLILPAGRELFREASVSRHGADWAARFDAVYAQADTVRTIGAPDDPPHPLAMRLAAEAAMGAAVMQARTLATEAVQLLILDSAEPAAGEIGGSAWMRQRWAESGRRQTVMIAPRDRSAHGLPTSLDRSAWTLTAMLAVEVDGADDAVAIEQRANALYPRLAEAVALGPPTLVPPGWSGETLRLAYDEPLAAARAARLIADALKDTGDIRIGGHYGLARRTPDPFGGPDRLLGSPAVVAEAIVRSVPPGAVHVTEDFAAALHAGPIGSLPRSEYVGDLPPDSIEDETRLFALKP
jgi:hypothetical protein